MKKVTKLTEQHLREIIKGELGLIKENPFGYGDEPVGQSLQQMQHSIHEIMEAMIMDHGEEAAYNAVMDAWERASQEVESGVDRD